MTKSECARGNESTTVVANDPDDRKGALKNIGGSQSDHWNNTARQSGRAGALAQELGRRDTRPAQLSATVAALVGIAPEGRAGRHDGGAADRRPQRRDGMLPPRHDRRADLRGTAREP